MSNAFDRFNSFGIESAQFQFVFKRAAGHALHFMCFKYAMAWVSDNGLDWK